MAFDVSVYERLRASCERMLLRAEPQIPVLSSEENWKALSGVADGACRDALQLGMLEIRCNDNVVLAKECFSRANTLSMALTAIPESAVVASSFNIPIYCCLLAHDLSGAERLATVALNEKVTPGSHFDLHAKMLSAFVLDKSEQFETHLQEFNKLGQLYWWGKQKIYFDLYSAVLHRDCDLYNQLLKNALAEFRLRAKDKNFGDQLREYGGGQHNQFAIDFMSVGIAVFAQSKELNCTVPHNEYFPASLIEFKF